MFQRRTSNRTPKSRQRMLSLKVSSPRIVFFDFLKFGGKFLKLGAIVTIMVGVGAGLSFGWQKLFVENDDFTISDFSLKTFDGKDPRFLTHARMLEQTGLDRLEPDATIFSLDTDVLAAALEGLPELTGAKVSRRLPGTLKIEVQERQPVAWVACRSLGIRERDRDLGLLVDSEGIPFKCASKTLWEYAEKLPVVLVGKMGDEKIIEGTPIEHRGLNYAFELIRIASESLVGIEKPAWVVVKDEITLEMKTLGGIHATLSYYDLNRQLTDFSKLVSHAQARGKELERVNLIPRRFVPVHYRGNL
ncbi:FtsQ-type POTRA domain-containing protein [Verrucomicrobiaceae bacterium 227]